MSVSNLIFCLRPVSKADAEGLGTTKGIVKQETVKSGKVILMGGHCPEMAYIGVVSYRQTAFECVPSARRFISPPQYSSRLSFDSNLDNSLIRLCFQLHYPFFLSAKLDKQR
jgi:hypothetical protein